MMRRWSLPALAEADLRPGRRLARPPSYPRRIYQVAWAGACPTEPQNMRLLLPIRTARSNSPDTVWQID
jgi:hypothetical protein